MKKYGWKKSSTILREIKLDQAYWNLEREDLRAYNIFCFSFSILSYWSPAVTKVHQSNERTRTPNLKKKTKSTENIWKYQNKRHKTHLVIMHEAISKPNFAAGSNENLAFQRKGQENKS